MIKTTKDGRTIRTGKDYTDFRMAVWDSQFQKCASCGRYAPFDPWWFQVHHKDGRGMGGGKRDDSMKAVIGLCWKCHGEQHGQ